MLDKLKSILYQLKKCVGNLTKTSQASLKILLFRIGLLFKVINLISINN